MFLNLNVYTAATTKNKTILNSVLCSATLGLQNGKNRSILFYFVFEKFNFFEVIADVKFLGKT